MKITVTAIALLLVGAWPMPTTAQQEGNAHRIPIAVGLVDTLPVSGHESVVVFGLPELNGRALVMLTSTATDETLTAGVLAAVMGLSRSVSPGTTLGVKPDQLALNRDNNQQRIARAVLARLRQVPLRAVGPYPSVRLVNVWVRPDAISR